MMNPIIVFHVSWIKLIFSAVKMVYRADNLLIHKVWIIENSWSCRFHESWSFRLQNILHHRGGKYKLIFKLAILYLHLYSNCSVLKIVKRERKSIRNSISQDLIYWKSAVTFYFNGINIKEILLLFLSIIVATIFISCISCVVLLFVILFFQFNKFPPDNLILHINGKFRIKTKEWFFTKLNFWIVFSVTRNL